MDKEWMSKHRLSREYEDGVESFLQFALQNCLDSSQISCPCAKCGNLKRKNVITVRAHLCCHGMDLTYHTWIFHGEKSKLATIVDERDDMFGGDQYQEEKDQHQEEEDHVDMVDDAYETFQDNPTQFKKILEDAEKPLYPDNKKFTKLSAIVKLHNLKARYGWSDTSFSDLLSLLRELLQDCNELPSSFYEVKKSLCTLGIRYEKIHACPNDCILYRKVYEDLDNWPSCGLSRWKKFEEPTELPPERDSS